MIQNQIKAKYPFLIDEFISEVAPLPIDIPEFDIHLEGHQLSIYNEDWRATLLRMPCGTPALVNNTYLSSFAYNAAAAWSLFSYELTNNSLPNTKNLAFVLRYNLKKFFAEQILFRKDCLFGRAILLETLLYEEDTMRQVLRNPQASTENTAELNEIASTLSSLLMFHEYGHIIDDEVAVEFPRFSGHRGYAVVAG